MLLMDSRLLPNGRLGARGTYELPLGNQNFKQGAQTGALKLTILRLTSSEQTTKFLPILHFKMTTEDVWSLARCKKIFSPINGKHTALCLEIRICDFRCRAVKVSRLKMVLNEFDSLRKNFNNKIMTFPSGLEMSGHYCMKSKLAKSRGPWKSKLVSNYTWHRWFP